MTPRQECEGGTVAKPHLNKSVRLVCKVCGRHSFYPGSLPSCFLLPPSLIVMIICWNIYWWTRKGQRWAMRVHEHSHREPQGLCWGFCRSSGWSSSLHSLWRSTHCHSVQDAGCPRPGTWFLEHLDFTSGNGLHRWVFPCVGHRGGASFPWNEPWHATSERWKVFHLRS